MKARNLVVSSLTFLAVLFLLSAVVGAPVPLQAQTIQVLSADPPSAAQGTVNLNVVIKGKGFKTGARAEFLITRTKDPGGIKVNSTTFVSDTELTANIDVADTAILSKYDIKVMNSDGRGGKGTELFSVTKKATACVVSEPVLTGGYCVSNAPGMPGCLDTSFGDGAGRVMAVRGMQINGIALQYVAGEARIVAAGQTFEDSCVSGGSEVWTVARFHADGTLDSSFGNGGVVKTTFLNRGSAYPYSVVVQPNDNKILVAGSAPHPKLQQNVPAVVRYNLDGSLDSMFAGGIVTVPYGRAGGWFEGVAIDSNHRIVGVGGYGYPGVLAVVRLNPNGTLDTNFNGTGQFLYTSNRSSGEAVAFQGVGTEERIVVAGHMVRTYAYDTAVLLRFTASGALDTSFGGTGLVLADHPPLPGGAYNGGFFHDLAVDPSNNSIVAVGELNSAIQIARYDVAGKLDPNFGEGGFVLPPMRSGQTAAIPYSVAIQSDGNILAAGWAFFGDSPWGMAAWRFTPQGMPDMLFGDGGWVNDSFPNEGTPYPHALANDLVMQSDGRFICAGDAQQWVGTTKYRYAALARFWQ